MDNKKIPVLPYQTIALVKVEGGWKFHLDDTRPEHQGILGAAAWRVGTFEEAVAMIKDTFHVD